ncbi:MAG: MBL fold metallo-hydrolase [Chitinophagales bacterium]
MRKRTLFLLGIVALLFGQCSTQQNEKQTQTQNSNTPIEPTDVANLKITTLSTMLANRGIGEWGYAALVEVNEHKILFDTGRKPETVLNNAEELGIDLSEVEHVFLSHNHGDHTGGLFTLRENLKQQNPKAMSKIHVGEGIFAPRINANNRMLDLKAELEADGVQFFTHKKSFELFPDVWITGPIERIHPEKNYGDRWQIDTDDGPIPDNIPEDQSLVINTDKGFIVVAGCGHAGIINTLAHVTSKITNKNIHAIIGGLHLVTATDEQLAWTANNLREYGVEKIIGAHCTGINSLYALRQLLDLDRKNAVVGSVGDDFTLAEGINPGIIAK